MSEIIVFCIVLFTDIGTVGIPKKPTVPRAFTKIPTVPIPTVPSALNRMVKIGIFAKSMLFPCLCQKIGIPNSGIDLNVV